MGNTGAWRGVISLIFWVVLPLTAGAQKGDAAELERLRSEMYRLYATDSLDRFMATTDRLKEVARRVGNEEYFYKAWSNQALFVFRKKNREEGQQILKAEKDYAEKHNHKYGIYSATSVNINFLSMLRINNQLEEEAMKCIDYVHKNFPNISVASEYITLARLYYNASLYRKTFDMAQKALEEPNLQDVHRQVALGYVCIAYSHLPDNEIDRQVFNEYYADYKKYAENTKNDFGLKGIVDYNYYRLNNNPKAALEAAKTVKAKANRLSYLANAYDLNGDYRQAYLTVKELMRYRDSINTAESRKMATEHSLQLDVAKAENEVKDLRLANQQLQLAHITDELEQRRLQEEALGLSLQKREAELAHAATKLKNDSLDKYNKDLQLSEYRSKMEAQESRERTQHLRLWSAISLGVLIIGFMAFYLHRRIKHAKEIGRHAKEIETAYDKLELAHEQLEDAYGKLEETTAAKERMESELRIAREIQMGMVPRIFPAFPERDDIDIYASLDSAKEVGGDLYDFFLQSDRLYFCIGDVSGKGIPASLFMSVIVNLFRMVAKEGFPPEYIATRLNETLAEDNENGMFCTMFIGEINLRTGRLNFCNAGHNPPIIIDRPISPHEPCRPAFIEMESNAPIGLWPELEFVGESIENVKDRTLFLYTDGLNEAENISHDQFGDDRLIKLFQTRPYDDARQTVDIVASAVAAFVGEAEQSDDLTMLCLKVK